MPLFEKTSEFPVSSEALFEWHKRPGALERLSPPWEDLSVLSREGGIDAGTVTLLLRKAGVSFEWRSRHVDYIEGKQFCDVLEKGPFAEWRHQHLVEPVDESVSCLRDRVEYRLSNISSLNALADGALQNMLDRMFAFRHLRTALDLQRHQKYAAHARLKIAIAGASGLIGSQLSSFLTTGGHTVYRLVRRAPDKNENEIYWNPSSEKIDADSLEGLDAVINLAGENIASGRWTEPRKHRIYQSRVDGTGLLARTLASLQNPPRVFISASAIGFYGTRADETLDESSSQGKGFLAKVCRAWENAAQPAVDAGVRVVHPRIGVVLSARGGALRAMLTPFRLGVGGPIANGAAWMSWISLDDLLGVFYECLFDEELCGPVNAVSPNPMSNREFTRTLARVLSRPAFLPVPAVVIRAILGEMGDELLLTSARVVPQKLSGKRFDWHHADLESALRFELGK
ncbi:MAG: TIGR01777 family protein [bacterium]|nr:TIGR01777 family protein [bacterium]